jgi:hypothetical protein
MNKTPEKTLAWRFRSMALFKRRIAFWFGGGKVGVIGVSSRFVGCGCSCQAVNFLGLLNLKN